MATELLQLFLTDVYICVIVLNVYINIQNRFGVYWCKFVGSTPKGSGYLSQGFLSTVSRIFDEAAAHILIMAALIQDSYEQTCALP